MMYHISKHASEERLERLCYIMEHLGLGEEVCYAPSRNEGRTIILTSTGVALVMGEDGCVITAYVATMKEATFIWFHNYENKRIPDWLYRKIKSNRPHYEDCVKLSAMLGYHEAKVHHKFY